MANSSVPKHDFVPAWLKISGESQQSTSVNSENRERLSRRDNRSSTKGPVFGRSRQSSCDQQYSHRDGQDPSNISYRHHSIDIDESQYYTYGLGNYRITGYRHFGSQPSLNRRTLSRQENPIINYPYKGYSLYDFAPDGCQNSNLGLTQGRHHSFERSSNNAQTEKKESIKGLKKDSKADRFNQEFPSLKGDSNDSASTSVSVNGSVWDKSRNTRVHLNCTNKKFTPSEKTVKNDAEKRSGSPDTENKFVCLGSLSVSNTVSPIGKLGKPTSPSIIQISKNSLQNQSPMYPLTTLVRKTSKESFKTASSIVNKNSLQSSPTPPPLEILNTRLVTHPKNVGNKNDFLKTLRSDSEKSASDMPDNKKSLEIRDANGVHCTDRAEVEDDMKNKDGRDDAAAEKKERMQQIEEYGTAGTNGIDCKRPFDHSKEKPVLSSSLEAEQRLLKEMGWKEEGSDDEEFYAPLTEDELREFENLSKQLKQKNGQQSRILQSTWSPKRLAPSFTNTTLMPLDDDSCSTSFSDSD